MNKTQLQNALSFLFQEDIAIGVEMYLILKEDDELSIKQADLGDNLPTEILEGFLNYLRGRTFENEDANVLPLSQLDNELSTIHHYDFSDLPEGLDIINSELVAENIPNFNFSSDSLERAKAFLLKIGTADGHIVLYKHHYQLNLLKQSKLLYVIGDSQRFTKPAEGILRLSFTFDFLRIGNEIFVYDSKCLQREFNFDDIIIHRAAEVVDEIEQLGFVENIDELKDFVAEKSGARRVLKINRNSPVLRLEFTQIKTFIKSHPYLSKRLKFNDDESQIRFHTQISKTYFIELMNDDYLTSDLTSKYYTSGKKDIMTEDQGNPENENIEENVSQTE